MAAALEVIFQFVREGKVLGPFPGDTRICPVTRLPAKYFDPVTELPYANLQGEETMSWSY